MLDEFSSLLVDDDNNNDDDCCVCGGCVQERELRIMNSRLFPRQSLERIGPLTTHDRTLFTHDDFVYNK